MNEKKNTHTATEGEGEHQFLRQCSNVFKIMAHAVDEMIAYYLMIFNYYATGKLITMCCVQMRISTTQ